MLPAVVFIVVAVVLCVNPVCIQWSRVLVAGGLFVGISRSIINTANDVPVNLDSVPTLGAV